MRDAPIEEFLACRIICIQGPLVTGGTTICHRVPHLRELGRGDRAHTEWMAAIPSSAEKPHQSDSESIHSGSGTPARTWATSQSHARALSPISAEMARGGRNLRGRISKSKVREKKPRCNPGSRMFGKGGGAGATPRVRATAPRSTGQYSAEPRSRKSLATWRI